MNTEYLNRIPNPEYLTEANVPFFQGTFFQRPCTKKEKRKGGKSSKQRMTVAFLLVPMVVKSISQ